jgi:hypothetical protein
MEFCADRDSNATAEAGKTCKCELQLVRVPSGVANLCAELRPLNTRQQPYR